MKNFKNQNIPKLRLLSKARDYTITYQGQGLYSYLPGPETLQFLLNGLPTMVQGIYSSSRRKMQRLLWSLSQHNLVGIEDLSYFSTKFCLKNIEGFEPFIKAISWLAELSEVYDRLQNAS